MSKHRLFQYAVIFQDEDSAKIIVPLTTVLGKDEKSLSLKITREIPEEYVENLDKVDIAIRPF